MPLKTQKLSIDFGLGVDEFTDRKLVKEGKLIKAENITFTGNKNVEKRAGFRPQTMNDLSGEPLESVNNIYKFNEQPLIMTDNHIYTDAESSAISDTVRWKKSGVFNLQAEAAEAEIGRYPTLEDPQTIQEIVEGEEIGNISIDQANLDSGLRCCVWAAAPFSNDEEVDTSFNKIGISVVDTLNEDNVILSGTLSQDGVDAWKCAKVIPFGPQGITPDRFIVIATGFSNVTTSNFNTDYYVFTISIDSNSVPYIENHGLFWNWANIYIPSDPGVVVQSIDDEVYGGGSAFGEAWDFDLKYDRDTSKIYLFDSVIRFDPNQHAWQTVPRAFMVEESSSSSAFSGVILGHRILQGIGPDPEHKPMRSQVAGYIEDASTDSVSFAFSAESLPQSVYSPNPLYGERVFSFSYNDSMNSPVLGLILASSAAAIEDREFYEEFSTSMLDLVPPVNLFAPSLPDRLRHTLIVHFRRKSRVSVDPPLAWVVGNDRVEYFAAYIVEIDISNILLPNTIVNRREIPFVRARSKAQKYTSGVGDNAKTGLVFSVSKKKNLMNIGGDNVGTEFLMFAEMDTETNDFSQDYNVSMFFSSNKFHVIAKMLQGRSFCGGGGQGDPRNISSSSIKGNVFSYLTPKFPSLGVKSVSSMDIELNADTQGIEYDECFYTSSGFLKVFDGEEYVENNFHFPPDVMGMRGTVGDPWYPVTIAFNETLSGKRKLKITEYVDSALADNPQYQFAFVWEWTDKDGNLHISEPSEIIQAQNAELPTVPPTTPPELGDSAYIDFAITPLPSDMTEKGNVLLKAYRTLNLTGETKPGTSLELFYDGSMKANKIVQDNGPDDGMLVYTFKNGDHQLVGRQRLYISNGILDNLSPPGADKMLVHDGRLMLLSSEDRNRIYYSKPKIALSSLEFNTDLLYIELSDKGGETEGIASIGGKLVIFKKDSTLITYGNQLNEQGVSGGYAPTTTLSPTIGATNREAIFTSQDGVFFQSYDSLYTVANNFSLQKIGLDIGKSLTSVISVASLPVVNELRIMHDDGVVVYNTLFKQWYTSTLKTVGNSIAISGKQFCIDATTGVLLHEDSSYYGDGTSAITTDIETAWIKMAGVQGYQRIRDLHLLGNLSSDTSFKLQLYYNYNEYPEETISITASDIASLEPYGVGDDPLDPSQAYAATTYYGGTAIDHIFQLRHKPKIQKCESIKLRIIEDDLAAPSKGYSLNNITMEIARKQPAFKLRESKTV